tara:strand:+ start:98 stop:457 length:360 start_codon:yes stop_codon:yes gene_type:complete
MIKKYKKAQSGSSINGDSDFEKAFAAARKAGKNTFTFKGKSYNTNLKAPVKTKVVKKNNSTGSLTAKQESKLEDADGVYNMTKNEKRILTEYYTAVNSGDKKRKDELSQVAWDITHPKF